KSRPSWEDYRAWLLTIGSVVLFKALGKYTGLVLATCALVFVSAFADRNNNIRTALYSAVLVTLLAVVVFYYGLNMPFPLFTLGSAVIDNIYMGFATALTLDNFFYSFVWVFVGNLVGVLPGIGALAAISMLLPITYGIEPAAALMMIAGLYYGAGYGGATTTILLNL